jgi:hypothetical protein
MRLTRSRRGAVAGFRGTVVAGTAHFSSRFRVIVVTRTAYFSSRSRVIVVAGTASFSSGVLKQWSVDAYDFVMLNETEKGTR